MENNNFKVKCIKSNNMIWANNKIYEFKNGVTIWDTGQESGYYKNIDQFLFGFYNYFEEYKEESKYYTVQDILLTNKFKDGQEFRVKIEDNYIAENVIYRVQGVRYLEYKKSKATLGLYDKFLTAKFYPVSKFKKTYIDNIKALELIQQGKKVWCEYDNKDICLSNDCPYRGKKKIRIDFILNGKWYVME